MTENLDAQDTSPSTEPQSAAPAIPTDLHQQWGAVQALALAFRALKEATHKQDMFKAVDNSMIFLKDLHEQALEGALAHGSAQLIPELGQILEQRTAIAKAEEKRKRKAEKKEAQDGEKETH